MSINCVLLFAILFHIENYALKFASAISHPIITIAIEYIEVYSQGII